jgi:hypothetical protein
MPPRLTNLVEFGPPRPRDIGLVIERLITHALKPRMSPDEFRETVLELGFESPEAFGERIGVPKLTIESWLRFGLSSDAAQLLLALVTYRHRLQTAMSDFEACTQVPISSFFEDHRLP